MNRLPFINFIDNVLPCTKMADNYYLNCVKYSSHNIKFDVFMHFIKTFNLILLILCMTYENPHIYRPT